MNNINYVIWKWGSKYKATPEVNYNAVIMNCNKVIDIEADNDEEAVKAVRMWLTPEGDIKCL